MEDRHPTPAVELDIEVFSCGTSSCWRVQRWSREGLPYRTASRMVRPAISVACVFSKNKCRVQPRRGRRWSHKLVVGQPRIDELVFGGFHMVDYLSLCEGPDESGGSLDLYRYRMGWTDEGLGCGWGRTWEFWHINYAMYCVSSEAELVVRADTR